MCCRHDDERECASCEAVRLKEERRREKVALRKKRRNESSRKQMANITNLDEAIRLSEARLAKQIGEMFPDGTGPVYEGVRRRYIHT